MASTHTTAETVGPKQAAAALGLSERALREAIKAKRVPAERVARGTKFIDRLRLDELAHALRALPRCEQPGCDRAGLSDNGGCGTPGHGRTGKRRSRAVGARISAAKKGVPQIERSATELTVPELAEATKAWGAPHPENGYDRRTLRDAWRGGWLRPGRTARRASGKGKLVPLFDEATAKTQIERRECSYPPCTTPAPGTSHRCGQHSSGVKWETVELVCQYSQCPRGGEPFTRPGSWLREREGRGHYCSNECKGAAFAESRPGYLQELNPDGAREHFRTVHEKVRASGMVLTPEIAQASATSMSTIRLGAARGVVPSEVLKIKGSRLRVYPENAAGDYMRKWVRSGPWKTHEPYLDPDFAMKQQQRKRRALVARGLTDRQATAVIRADAEARYDLFRHARRRLSPGPPSGRPPLAHHITWQAEFRRLRDHYERRECAGEPRPTDEQIIVEAAKTVHRRHPDVFDYDPTDPGFKKNVAARGRAALKSLQMRENPN